ncbi:putative lipoprotein [Yersinia pseudotuberculosis]|uniref:Putative lipoprotein n=4 Tax=Yersinia pseudotuberculosis complex TaxID=1649845 RepID=A0A380Q5E8_YERPU|nr:putative lipoprotein [Yersinia pseudotuberculosis]
MNKFLKKISINLLAISLGGCGMILNPLLMEKAEVEPNNLPDGKLGQPYYAKLRITGGGGAIASFKGESMPVGSGLVLTLDNPERPPGRDELVIKGIPVISGDITFRVNGSLFSSAGKGYFGKEYKLKIAE